MRIKLDNNLTQVSSFCIYHLVNIAVKRAISHLASVVSIVSDVTFDDLSEDKDVVVVDDIAAAEDVVVLNDTWQPEELASEAVELAKTDSNPAVCESASEILACFDYPLGRAGVGRQFSARFSS